MGVFCREQREIQAMVRGMGGGCGEEDKGEEIVLIT